MGSVMPVSTELRCLAKRHGREHGRFHTKAGGVWTPTGRTFTAEENKATEPDEDEQRVWCWQCGLATEYRLERAAA